MIETSFRGNATKTTSKQFLCFVLQSRILPSEQKYFQHIHLYLYVSIFVSDFKEKYPTAPPSKVSTSQWPLSFSVGRCGLFFSVGKWRGKERIVDISFKVKLWFNGQKLRQKYHLHYIDTSYKDIKKLCRGVFCRCCDSIERTPLIFD